MFAKEITVCIIGELELEEDNIICNFVNEVIFTLYFGHSGCMHW